MDILNIENLNKRFEDLSVLENINLNIKKGEFVSIVGPSGCGKSTLFKLITGLTKTYDGSLKIENIEVKNYKKSIGYMPQKDLLLPWRTLFKNLSLPLELKKISKQDFNSYINPLLDDFGLKGFEHYYPNKLSGGMKQRAALLRTFLIGSELLLLDEPFGALDAITRSNLQNWLLEIWSKYNHTVLFITHDIEEAIYLSDRIYVMSSNPGTLIKEFNINIKRPRNSKDTLTNNFLNYKKDILQYLK